MDTARQILRYSIPGSLCILTALAVGAVLQVAARHTLTEINAGATQESIVALIAASIPLGFLLYQIYYAAYGPFVRRRDGGVSFVSRDRGADVLQALPPDRLDQLRAVFGARLDVRTWYKADADRTRVARRLNLLQLDEPAVLAAYTLSRDGSGAMRPGTPAFPYVEVDPRRPTRIFDDNWRENWSVFRSLLDLAATRGDARELKAEFTTLSDIYHTLGAARYAVVLGAFLGGLYVVFAHTHELGAHPLREAGAALAALAVAGVLITLLHRARRHTWLSALACAHYGLCWCFDTHPELLAHLDGRNYSFAPRTQLRRGTGDGGLPHEPPDTGAA